MWVQRFKDYLHEQLVAANHPGIARIETYEAGGQSNLKVVGTDGVEISLLITRSAAPGGEKYDGEEHIVTKSDLANAK